MRELQVDPQEIDTALGLKWKTECSSPSRTEFILASAIDCGVKRHGRLEGVYWGNVLLEHKPASESEPWILARALYVFALNVRPTSVDNMGGLIREAFHEEGFDCNQEGLQSAYKFAAAAKQAIMELAHRDIAQLGKLDELSKAFATNGNSQHERLDFEPQIDQATKLEAVRLTALGMLANARHKQLKSASEGMPLKRWGGLTVILTAILCHATKSFLRRVTDD